MTNSQPSLGKIDRNILRILQKEGRISYAELARRVGLSTTPCTERVKKLEKSGAITGYNAVLDPHVMNAGLTVFVQIRLSRTSSVNFAEFQKAVKNLKEVQECYLVSGGFDYLIKARVADMTAYRELLGDTLLKLPAVDNSSSIVVMETIVETLNIPVPP